MSSTQGVQQGVQHYQFSSTMVESWVDSCLPYKDLCNMRLVIYRETLNFTRIIINLYKIPDSRSMRFQQWFCKDSTWFLELTWFQIVLGPLLLYIRSQVTPAHYTAILHTTVHKCTSWPIVSYYSHIVYWCLFRKIASLKVLYTV